ncbi:MAG: hypothetical protein V9E87_00190 [Gemmatimonadales bacterium]
MVFTKRRSTKPSTFGVTSTRLGSATWMVPTVRTVFSSVSRVTEV